MAPLALRPLRAGGFGARSLFEASAHTRSTMKDFTNRPGWSQLLARDVGLDVTAEHAYESFARSRDARVSMSRPLRMHVGSDSEA